jgi:hypothetical protein
MYRVGADVGGVRRYAVAGAYISCGMEVEKLALEGEKGVKEAL